MDLRLMDYMTIILTYRCEMIMIYRCMWRMYCIVLYKLKSCLQSILGNIFALFLTKPMKKSIADEFHWLFLYLHYSLFHYFSFIFIYNLTYSLSRWCYLICLNLFVFIFIRDCTCIYMYRPIYIKEFIYFNEINYAPIYWFHHFSVYYCKWNVNSAKLLLFEYLFTILLHTTQYIFKGYIRNKLFYRSLLDWCTKIISRECSNKIRNQMSKVIIIFNYI